MKTPFILLLTLLTKATFAWASPKECPQVSGIWNNCLARTSSGELVPFPGTHNRFSFTKKLDGTVTKISWVRTEAGSDSQNYELIPDGVKHSLPSGTDATTSCEAEKLVIVFEYVPLNWKSTMVFTRESNKLVMRDPSLSQNDPMEICE